MAGSVLDLIVGKVIRGGNVGDEIISQRKSGLK
jgi:hypothetical protein